jgi:hypothetical protein
MIVPAVRCRLPRWTQTLLGGALCVLQTVQGVTDATRFFQLVVTQMGTLPTQIVASSAAVPTTAAPATDEAVLPEVVVTPECVFTRHRSGPWHTLHTDGRMVSASVRPIRQVRQFCLNVSERRSKQ